MPEYKRERRLVTERPAFEPPTNDSPFFAKFKAWALRSPLYTILLLGVFAPLVVFPLYGLGKNFTQINHNVLRLIVLGVALVLVYPFAKLTSRPNFLMGALIVFVLLISYIAIRPSLVHR